MREIAKKRQYKNPPRGDRHGRTVVPQWKRKIIQSIDVLTREAAETLGAAAGVSARQIYKIRAERL